ncbi:MULTISPECIES: lipid-A-disaccharide synthase N-terminal domain-containing protein [Mesoflavibacter]|uniref:Lipid-A-disaccharide synthase N-terminal domain-containing protein n=1 Tax=Mesoflavibacter profundi TaxID=2708110 RepID=A0ABT4RWT3_9FLAO|nr:MULTISPECIES: lipid-A-disaccharide synthase N-terminal domain-containing protein [Mesoflavibacter]MDA0176098.1 lipid-A-disaccharide synthase N-terminal domain-containing protein [Mesoflavibacter profundi]QIJ89732.1 Lipid-A-disaccharide synthase [Mesoflavibacter sp. HG96]QIJ92460.1 Lipid-A-disaccharide synthase [Mesoflavibacter sp. HG37]
MSDWLIYSIGFLAQILFSSRLIIQWITSEKQKKVITPTLFWTLSLIASFLLFIYGYLRNDFAIMLGQGLTYYIYIRNLQLQNQWKNYPKLMQWILLLMPVFVTVFYFNNNEIDTVKLFKNEAIPLWLLLLGIISQIVFTFRFVYQWMYSEKHKESSLPFGFWALSLIGSILILTYAIFRKDPVLLVGHLLGATIYVRNLIILKKQYA